MSLSAIIGWGLGTDFDCMPVKQRDQVVTWFIAFCIPYVYHMYNSLLNGIEWILS
jgi:hypothetical protein